MSCFFTNQLENATELSLEQWVPQLIKYKDTQAQLLQWERFWTCTEISDQLFLHLYVCFPYYLIHMLDSSKPFVDALIVRENTECLYVKKERLEDNGNTAIADRVITRKASTRIAELVIHFLLSSYGQAFKQASRRKQQRPSGSKKQAMVTIVHKSNVLSVTDGTRKIDSLTIRTFQRMRFWSSQEISRYCSRRANCRFHGLQTHFRTQQIRCYCRS